MDGCGCPQTVAGVGLAPDATLPFTCVYTQVRALPSREPSKERNLVGVNISVGPVDPERQMLILWLLRLQ